MGTDSIASVGFSLKENEIITQDIFFKNLVDIDFSEIVLKVHREKFLLTNENGSYYYVE